MIADLENPVVPSAVQSVLASASASAAEAAAAASSRGGAGGRGRSKPADAASGVSTSGSAGDALWSVPPLGNPKSSNRAEVST
jgi:hypothetical protein